MRKAIAVFVVVGALMGLLCGAALAVDFKGNWYMFKGDADTQFWLHITQSGKVVKGSHKAVLMGDKVDSSNGEVSIYGTTKEKMALVTFRSFASNNVGRAMITKLSDNMILWQLVVPPEGDFYVPKEAYLKLNKK